jgi:phosphorylated CTD-interacting factor 1
MSIEPLPPPEKKQKRHRATSGPLHKATALAPTGAGQAAAAEPGRRARLPPGALCDLSVPPPAGLGPVCLRAVPCSAAAAAVLEAARSRALDKLRQKLHALCAAEGLQAPPQLALERWRFACKAAEPERSQPRKRSFSGPVDGNDPLLPVCGDGGGLVADLRRTGLPQAAAEGIAEKLLAASVAKATSVAKAAQRLNSQPDAKLAAVNVVFHRHSVTLELEGAFVSLQRDAYGKLAALHRMHAPEDERCPVPPQPTYDECPAALWEAAVAETDPHGSSRLALHHRLFTLALRYKSIHGAGFQAAAGPEVMGLLTQHLGCAMECFASPLNARWAHHCSAFPDTDAPFGSHGSFFTWAERGGLRRGGAFEVNPPFINSQLDAAAKVCLQSLDAAAAAGMALTFAYITPGWTDGAGRNAIKASPYMTLALRVAAADHGFVDGASHGAGRVDPYRPSPYDTELYVLQTAKAFKERPAGSELEGALRDAFARCAPSNAALKRQGRA